MTQGMVARFRTMAIARVSVLAGHVARSSRPDRARVAVTLVVALLLGYRPGAGVTDWLGIAVSSCC